MESPRVGLVGPGRTRNGLGPFQAAFLEQAGGRVVAASGRDSKRTQQACDDLANRLGHGVDAEPSLEALLARSDLDALIIACPASGHEAALRGAVEVGLHALCEKPLVPLDRQAEVAGLCDQFEGRGLVLMENAQWPEVLGIYDDLKASGTAVDWRPESAVERRRRSVAMGLSPAGTGFAMCEDSISHLISVIQAVAPVDGSTVVERAEWSDRSEASVSTALHAQLRTGEVVVDVRFDLEQVPQQPRPAWIEIDGVRVDRSVDPEAGYQMALTGPDRIARPVGDPMKKLVYRFAQLCGVADDSRVALERLRIRHRAPLYRAFCEAFHGPSPT